VKNPLDRFNLPVALKRGGRVLEGRHRAQGHSRRAGDQLVPLGGWQGLRCSPSAPTGPPMPGAAGNGRCPGYGWSA